MRARMAQENLGGPAGQAGGDGVAVAEPGDGAGADVGADPCEVAAGEDSRLHPASAAQASVTAQRREPSLIAAPSVTAGSIRTVTLVTGLVGGTASASLWGFDVDAHHRGEAVQALLEPGYLGVAGVADQVADVVLHLHRRR